jgi:hypothetical protein
MPGFLDVQLAGFDGHNGLPGQGDSPDIEPAQDDHATAPMRLFPEKRRRADEGDQDPAT